jgi:signal transduction histidine kinase
VHALRPQALEDSNLPDALARLIERMTSGTPIEAKFQIVGAMRLLPPDTEHNLLRIGTEALTNALKHAQASEIRVTLGFGATQVRLSVQDNGSGFNLSDQSGRGGFGLTSMRERAERLGSQITIVSEPGLGTTVTVAAPISPS